VHTLRTGRAGALLLLRCLSANDMINSNNQPRATLSEDREGSKETHGILVASQSLSEREHNETTLKRL
jgi:hypothetical protein